MSDMVDCSLEDRYVFLLLDPCEELVDALDGAEVVTLSDVFDELLALVGRQVADRCAVSFDPVESHVAIVVPSYQKSLVLQL